MNEAFTFHTTSTTTNFRGGERGRYLGLGIGPPRVFAIDCPPFSPSPSLRKRTCGSAGTQIRKKWHFQHEKFGPNSNFGRIIWPKQNDIPFIHYSLLMEMPNFPGARGRLHRLLIGELPFFFFIMIIIEHLKSPHSFQSLSHSASIVLVFRGP